MSFYSPPRPARARSSCAGPAASARSRLMLLPSHARGTMSVLRPEARHLSPAVGLALSSGGSHLLSRLFELEPTLADGALIETAAGVARWKGTPVCRLARELFHRQHPAETLKITANRSLPAAHLSPSLAGASHLSLIISHLSPLACRLAPHLLPLTSRLSPLALPRSARRRARQHGVPPRRYGGAQALHAATCSETEP